MSHSEHDTNTQQEEEAQQQKQQLEIVAEPADELAQAAPGDVVVDSVSTDGFVSDEESVTGRQTPADAPGDHMQDISIASIATSSEPAVPNTSSNSSGSSADSNPRSPPPLGGASSFARLSVGSPTPGVASPLIQSSPPSPISPPAYIDPKQAAMLTELVLAGIAPKVARLFVGVRANDKSEVEAALSRGASANAVDQTGRTPLMVAAAAAAVDVMPALIGAGGNLFTVPAEGGSIVDLAADANTRATILRNMLRIGCEVGDSSKVQSALHAGADANAIDPSTGWTPLMAAAHNGHLHALASILLNAGADWKARNAVGRSVRELITSDAEKEVFDAQVARKLLQPPVPPTRKARPSPSPPSATDDLAALTPTEGMVVSPRPGLHIGFGSGSGSAAGGLPSGNHPSPFQVKSAAVWNSMVKGMKTAFKPGSRHHPNDALSPEEKQAADFAAARAKAAAAREARNEENARIWRFEVFAAWPPKKQLLRRLCWDGIPSSLRSQVWPLVVKNPLGITHAQYHEYLRHAQHLRAELQAKELLEADNLLAADSKTEESEMIQASAEPISSGREMSILLIEQDLPRTFQHLAFFHGDGPLAAPLRNLLQAYVCYRPDVGFVQGMTHLAATFLLFVDEADAFQCFANLLNTHFYFDLFRLEPTRLQPHLKVFDCLFQENLPTLHKHFQKLSISPNNYLLDWMMTLFTRTLELDVAARVWDCYLVEGQLFIFRAALGLLKACSSHLLAADMEGALKALKKMPSMVTEDALFECILSINVSHKRFRKLLDQAEAGENLAARPAHRKLFKAMFMNNS